jgi:mannose-6-phosphate isomerase-like protein (cupin superfamily)
MKTFLTKSLPVMPDAKAPDGSDVRVLVWHAGGGMAHFELAPGQTSKAVTHRTVEDIWFFTAGRGQMWREQGGESEIVDVFPGVCLTIPLDTHFQFRSGDSEALAALGVTMPPWPGEGEAIPVQGPWPPSATREGSGGDVP